MPTAVIHGELHTSPKDDAILHGRGFSQFDAVLRESMDQMFRWRVAPFYLLLFAGMKLYINTLQRTMFVSKSDLYAAARGASAEPHRLDIRLDRWNARVPFWKKLFAFIISLYVVVALSSRTGLSTPVVAVLSLVLFPLLYFLYLGILTVAVRDDLMVKQILELTEREGYDTVLVSVGDAHVERMAKLLEERGWDVETHRSTSWFAKPIRYINEAIGRL